MKGKPLIMIGIAVIFGAVSIFVADIWLKQSARTHIETVEVAIPAVQQPQTSFGAIVVARQPLRFGMTLTPDLLETIPWSQDSVPEGAFTSVDELLQSGERVVLSAIEPNEPVLTMKLSGPNGRGGLASLLSPGMRAVTIRVDDVTGVAGFVSPGDLVDVMLTRESVGGRDNPGTRVDAEILLSGVKVLSKDQNADDRSTGAELARSVTVEVTMDDARRIAVAQTAGTLSLVLRPAGEAVTQMVKPEAEQKAAFSFGDFTAAFSQKPVEEPPLLATVVVTRAHETTNYTVVSEGRKPGAARLLGDALEPPPAGSGSSTETLPLAPQADEAAGTDRAAAPPIAAAVVQ